MGNAKSTCKVSNEARYEIQVDVFGADDVGLEFAKLQIRLQPGQLGSISTSKKGVQLRIAGNGRVQQPILVCPGETINVHKVHRGTAAPHADDMQADSPVREEPAVESPSREARSRSAADQQRRGHWLDEKEKYTKDELEQLLVKLRKEAARDQRPKPTSDARVEAEEEELPAGDELSARIAALQQRGNKENSAKKATRKSKRTEEQQPVEEHAARLNTDASTDELMAAINKLSQARFHAKKPSWDMTQPQIVAQI